MATSVSHTPVKEAVSWLVIVALSFMFALLTVCGVPSKKTEGEGPLPGSCRGR